MLFGIAERHVGAAAPEDVRTLKITCGRGVRPIAKRQQAAALEKRLGNGKRLCLGGDGRRSRFC
jgi:hypothetical protein